MAKRNMSDIIESYLKRFLNDSEQIEIKRSDIAERFDCVPSQVNYVINTRFTQAHGYQVESKRGGGGYIRILKIQLVDEVDYIDRMIDLLDKNVSDKFAHNMINTMIDDEVMSEREGRILQTLISNETLEPITDFAPEVRTYLLKKAFEQLRIN
ncbi:CtsR family transcriptional regulator [Aerococcaceae bacterium DSM 111020]|nr:CtsR family transcriptional regulator [Aerococcaceae bacterium DSM 111020]